VLLGRYRLGSDAGQPLAHRRGDGFGVGLEAVVARYLDHLAQRSGRRDSEAIALALDDECRHGHRVQLGEAALRRLARAARRLEREREAKDCDCAGRLDRPAGDPGAERATADYQGQAGQLVLAQLFDDRDPGGVELRCAWGRAAAGDAVGLLDQRDGDPLRACRRGRCDEVRRLHAAGGPVPEDESRAWLLDGVQMGAREALRRLDLAR
jgi:hypothetical protein